MTEALDSIDEKVKEQINLIFGFDPEDEAVEDKDFWYRFIPYTHHLSETVLYALGTEGVGKDIQQSILNHHGKKEYDIRYLADILLGYAFASLVLYDRNIDRNLMHDFVNSAPCSQPEKKRIIENIDYVMDDMTLVGAANYVASAENILIDYLMTGVYPKGIPSAVKGDSLCAAIIRGYLISYLKELKQNTDFPLKLISYFK